MSKILAMLAVAGVGWWWYLTWDPIDNRRRLYLGAAVIVALAVIQAIVA